MAPTFLSGSNPVLVRELRAGLRSVRAFALLAIYVALLGAIVTVNFPANFQIELTGDGGARGQDLFWTLVWAQVALILLLIPALSTGALAQERERQTLEPLLLSPLTPLQIVWGKAGGVLSIVGLLLLASLPLTSLCFLLGGVSPGMLVAAYAGIFGLAVFTTGFGLYCAARWPGATRALVACYLLLPVALSLVLVFLPLGALFSGLCVLAMLIYGLMKGWKRGETSEWAQKIGPLYGKLIYVLAPLLVVGLLGAMFLDRNLGLIAVGIGFILSYFVMAAQWGLLQTARELMLRQDPEAPMRQKIADFKSDWQNAVATNAVPPAPIGNAASSGFGGSGAPYLPAPQTQNEWSQMTAPSPTAMSAPSNLGRKKSKSADSYGVAPFLSDKLNPIYARELRSGLLGKFEYLFRFSYGLIILTQVVLLAYLVFGLYYPDSMQTDFSSVFAFWGRWHLALLMIFSAWFGARSIAPEREGQTLSQLFTIPLPPRQIIGGKLAAVLTFTCYVQVLALPLALLLPMTGLISSWGMSLQFLLVEAVLGALAAAWGVFCSFHCGSVRSALSWSLGGAATLLVAHVLVNPLVDVLHLLGALKISSGAGIAQIFPVPLLFPAARANDAAPFALAFYALLALFLVWKTARDFHRMAREA
ncbi:ABC-type transport system involved in multi-copper enzyme maturation, permease component [Abditibacterium utsteinense]|uniref:ABC-type transport system involved in multi-copper enzyme maturation, permease component n=1 Tax=Abditibacterium utsteinense TaxID=1960156 RepID=A0A2S8SRM2_9BACT|nr:ABC transporter permease [Abditibacterium utsteinense]PQV63399.1 ABC-type transport system involved in multi-copper enzyme maturation, permease component [Abditibacterium utsteinense]